MVTSLINQFCSFRAMYTMSKIKDKPTRPVNWKFPLIDQCNNNQGWVGSPPFGGTVLLQYFLGHKCRREILPGCMGVRWKARWGKIEPCSSSETKYGFKWLFELTVSAKTNFEGSSCWSNSAIVLLGKQELAKFKERYGLFYTRYGNFEGDMNVYFSRAAQLARVWVWCRASSAHEFAGSEFGHMCRSNLKGLDIALRPHQTSWIRPRKEL